MYKRQPAKGLGNVTSREYAKRRDEIFFRVTKGQLYELYNEYEADEYESIAETAGGRGGRIVTYSETDQPLYSKPYLLLDLRDIDEFQSCHLLQARSFSYAQLRRDSYPAELYRYRNAAEHLIICYCNDERISRLAAQDLVDRGIDNVFVLTGGLFEFAAEYPAFVEGTLPDLPSSPRRSVGGQRTGGGGSGTGRGGVTDSGRKVNNNLPRIAEHEELQPPSPDGRLTLTKLARHNASYPKVGDGAASGPALTSGRRNFRATGGQGPRSEAGTQQSNMSVAESVISRATARKGKF